MGRTVSYFAATVLSIILLKLQEDPFFLSSQVGVFASAAAEHQYSTISYGVDVNSANKASSLSEKSLAEEENNEFVLITDLPSVINQRYIKFTIRCRCFTAFDYFVSVSIMTRDGNLLSTIYKHVHSLDRWASGGDQNVDRGDSHNMTHVLDIPTADIYYDPRKNIMPTNAFSSFVSFQVTLRCFANDSNDDAKVTRKKLTDEKRIPLLPPMQRTILPGYCYSWAASMKRRLADKRIKICPSVGASAELIPTIVAVSGNEAGFMRKLNDMVFPKDTPLHYVERVMSTSRFTLSTWIYVDQYCKRDFCAILSHRNHTTFFSPAILLNREGFLHIQLHRKNGLGEAFLTKRVPLRKWIHLILSVNEQEATFLFADRMSTNSFFVIYSHLLQEPVHCNITDGAWMVGGYNAFPGILGFVGPTRLYKYRYVRDEDIYLTQRDQSFIFNSGIHQYLSRCQKLASMVLNFMAFGTYQQYKGECRRTSWSNRFLQRSPARNEIDSKNRSISHSLMQTVKYILSTTNNTSLFPNMTQMGLKFYDIAKQYLFERDPNFVLLNFEISGCLGTYKALNEAGAFLTSGLFGTGDPSKAFQYQVVAAMKGNGLAQLALGYKHQIGSAGVAMSCHIAAGYLKSAAILSKYLIENEKSEVHTHSELIRLDEADKVANFRGSKSDVVKWLSQQAARGSSEAQGKIAEILFHGHHGVDINRNQAVNFYRLGANQGDPMALYNLGVLHLRGLEVEKNESKGVELFRKSAAQNFSLAFNSLGYVELVIKKNKTAAAQYFRRGIELNDKESMFHYGSLLEGGIDKQLPNKTAALEYFQKSAARGQKAACVKVADSTLLGELPKHDCSDAIKYYRYVAEQLSDLGVFLRQGLDRYLAGNWRKSLLGYLLVAEAGLPLGAYNMALLCEEYEEIQHIFNGTCGIYFFNLSAELGYPASLTAMGDRSWHGKGIRKDVQKSALYYARALEAGESPQALFSLGYLVEHNYNIGGIKFSSVRKDEVARGNHSLAQSLYERCMKLSYREYEGFYPCYVASLFLTIKMAVMDPYISLSITITALFGCSVGILVILAGDDIT